MGSIAVSLSCAVRSDGSTLQVAARLTAFGGSGRRERGSARQPSLTAIMQMRTSSLLAFIRATSRALVRAHSSVSITEILLRLAAYFQTIGLKTTGIIILEIIILYFVCNKSANFFVVLAPSLESCLVVFASRRVAPCVRACVLFN